MGNHTESDTHDILTCYLYSSLFINNSFELCDQPPDFKSSVVFLFTFHFFTPYRTLISPPTLMYTVHIYINPSLLLPTSWELHHLVFPFRWIHVNKMGRQSPEVQAVWTAALTAVHPSGARRWTHRQAVWLTYRHTLQFIALSSSFHFTPDI